MARRINLVPTTLRDKPAPDSSGNLYHVATDTESLCQLLSERSYCSSTSFARARLLTCARPAHKSSMPYRHPGLRGHRCKRRSDDNHSLRSNRERVANARRSISRYRRLFFYVSV